MTIGMAIVLVPVARAAGPPCRVTNLTTEQVYDGAGSNLQTAINQAASGTRLRVRGICVGNFVIDKKLTLIGRSTLAYPVATLDADREGRPLTVSLAGSVVAKDLRVTNGFLTRRTSRDAVGGGIFNDGTLTLATS